MSSANAWAMLRFFHAIWLGWRVCAESRSNPFDSGRRDDLKPKFHSSGGKFVNLFLALIPVRRDHQIRKVVPGDKAIGGLCRCTVVPPMAMDRSHIQRVYKRIAFSATACTRLRQRGFATIDEFEMSSPESSHPKSPQTDRASLGESGTRISHAFWADEKRISLSLLRRQDRRTIALTTSTVWQQCRFNDGAHPSQRA